MSLTEEIKDFETEHGQVAFLKLCGSALNRLLVLKNLVTETELTTALQNELNHHKRKLGNHQIEAAINVVGSINFDAAYGHNPELCKATNKVLGVLRKMYEQALIEND